MNLKSIIIKFLKNATQFKLLLSLILLWRMVLWLVGYLGDKFMPYSPTFPYADAFLQPSQLPRWLYSWGNFDGVHYITIASIGYLGMGLIQAFFPLYPLMIWLLTWFKIQPVLGGLLISNLAVIGFAWSWIKLVKNEYNHQIAWLSLLIVLFFPSAFFLGAIYNESLFLFFTIQAFFWARQKKWWLSGIMVTLATATRLVGVFLIVALILENWTMADLSFNLKNLKLWLKKEKFHLMIIVSGLGGILAYMGYLSLFFKDALLFIHVQAEFGAGRQESLVLWPQVVWRYWKIIATYQPHDWKYFAISQEFLLSLIGLVILILAVKKVRWSYLVFAVGAYFLPTLTGTFSSMPRYLLVCFPIWIWLALFLDQRKWLKIAWLLISGFLLILNTILFIQGYWVS